VPIDLERELRAAMDREAVRHELSPDFPSAVDRRVAQLARRQHWRIGAAVALIVGSFATITFLPDRGDDGRQIVAGQPESNAGAVSYELESIPAGFARADPNVVGSLDAPEVVCERWRLVGGEPVCDALLGHARAEYQREGARPGWIAVETIHGGVLQKLLDAPHALLPGEVEELPVEESTVTVRGHAAHLLRAGTKASREYAHAVVWEDAPGVVVVVRVSATQGVQLPDVQELAEGVTSRPLSGPAQFIVASRPASSSDASEVRPDVWPDLKYLWFVTTSLGDPADRCAWYYVHNDSDAGLDAAGGCVEVPPEEPVAVAGTGTLRFGVARDNVKSLEVEVEGQRAPIELWKASIDLPYRFFTVYWGLSDSGDPAILRAYDSTGRLLTTTQLHRV
jgi:hypothetical protein